MPGFCLFKLSILQLLMHSHSGWQVAAASVVAVLTHIPSHRAGSHLVDAQKKHEGKLTSLSTCPHAGGGGSLDRR
jgi:hypothetical protein